MNMGAKLAIKARNTKQKKSCPQDKDMTFIYISN